jgi:ABC-type glycerol-3-phosphate transport system substrate-binding protein
MTRALAALATALLLAACGADGAPVPPREAEATQGPGGTTLTITGDARFGAEATL